MSRNTIKSIFLLVVIVALILATFLFANRSKMPENLINQAAAQEIVENILMEDEVGNEIVAYLWPQVLVPGDVVESWGYDEENEIKEGDFKKMEDYKWLAWIDREPGNLFFAHETEFIYIDAVSGEYEKIPQDFWPLVNDESFEGSDDNMIVLDEFEDESEEVIGKLKDKITAYIKKSVFKPAQAQSGTYLRIDPDETDKPQGEYYALIVSGFGRNSWVFMDGTQAMYEALKSVGYDDAHITYLAQGPAKLDPSWNRQGNPQLVTSDSVDEATSPDNLEAALNSITSQMTDQDSLFVFMMVHGKRNQLVIGRPAANNQQSDINRALKGRRASFRSVKFADALLGGETKACEIMVLFDSCYSGTHENPLKAKYDAERIKRLQVGHSTSEWTKSYGADYQIPVGGQRNISASLDVAARRTPVADPNPQDFGGEFSSGFISNVGQTIFGTVYEAGVALDAAQINEMTEPFIWQLGTDGPCGVILEDPMVSGDPNPLTDPPAEEPQDELTEPEEEVVKEMIKVVPYNETYIPLNQLKVWSAATCDCCDADHYHAVSGGSVTTVDGQKVMDPFADCGLGKVNEMPVTEIEKP